MKKYKIVWSDQAKYALKQIYLYYIEHSIDGAEKVKNDILQSPKSIYFSNQYQLDDINPKYRRIVVRDYKVLYLEKNNVILVLDIVNTKEHPHLLKNK